MSESKTFKRTGRNVTVSREDLINTMIDRLMNYDSMTRAEKNKVSNPYRAPVYTKVSGGKTVQIPRHIQHLAIVKWTSMKKRAELSESSIQDGHTRLNKRTRYNVRDPFVMNKELNQLGGEKSDIYDDRDPSSMDLSADRKENMAMRRNVGSVDVPDLRYGRGGSQDDLPRDMVDFARVMERDIQDMPYETSNHEKGHIMPFEGRYLYRRDMPEHSHDYLDEQLVESKNAVRTQSIPYGRYKPLPGSGNDVLGTEVLAEANTTETEGVEHYAPVNEKYHLDDSRYQLENSTNDCKTCTSGYEDDRDIVDEEIEYDENTDYIDDKEYLDSDQDEPIVDLKGNSLDNVENYDGDYDHTYKYLFFLLLLIIVVFVVYKKKNGDNL
jgi:hypothetical protein